MVYYYATKGDYSLLDVSRSFKPPLLDLKKDMGSMFFRLSISFGELEPSGVLSPRDISNLYLTLLEYQCFKKMKVYSLEGDTAFEIEHYRP